MEGARVYIAAAHWRTPRTFGCDEIHLRLFFGTTPRGVGVEATVIGRVVSLDRDAENIMVVYTSGESLIASVRELLEGAEE